jgi:orotidine-5'-phosphate decarboxylase
MNRQELIFQIMHKKSFLCVGLDSDIKKIPSHLLKLDDPIFEFNKQIIDKTKDFCVAYKPNVAFYESMGSKGWESLEKTLAYIPDNIFTIADAKRGDIGNTSNMYGRAFFQHLNFDSVTIAPYMGEDSIAPFLEFKNKWAIILALTSNNGSLDFQNTEDAIGKPLFKKVIEVSKNWGTYENIMYVVGANKAEKLLEIREIIPKHFLLVPGVGAQGGSLKDIAKYGMNSDCGLLVNSSRGIIYAGNGIDFADKAKVEAQKLQNEMAVILSELII